MKILKYELKAVAHQSIFVGTDVATPLSVAEQNGKLMLWAQVDAGSQIVYRKCHICVRIIGTGEQYSSFAGSFPGKKDFLGTVVMSDGLVWHVFARPTYTNGK